MLPVQIKCQHMQLLYGETLSGLPQLWVTFSPIAVKCFSGVEVFLGELSSSCALPLSSFAWSRDQTPSGPHTSNSACVFFFFFWMESARLQTASDPTYLEGSLCTHAQKNASPVVVQCDGMTCFSVKGLFDSGGRIPIVCRFVCRRKWRVKKSRCTKAARNAFDLLCNNESSPPHRPAWCGLKGDL